MTHPIPRKDGRSKKKFLIDNPFVTSIFFLNFDNKKNWWQPNKKNSFFPICVGQRTKVHLNGCDFYINIVCGNKESPFFPGYVCETDTMCKAPNKSVKFESIQIV